MEWEDALKALVFWGPGALIAGLMIYATYRFASDIGVQFIEVQKEQAEALCRQAQGMEGVRDSIHAFVMRDNNEHREMIILLKVIAEKIERLDNDGRKKRKIQED